MVNIRFIIYFSLTIALLLLFTFTPFLGYIQIGIISITLIPCVVMIISLIWIKILKINAFLSGVISGLLMGLSSWAVSFVFVSLFAGIFQHPFFSVLPRVLMGVISGLFLILMPWKLKTTTIIWTFLVITSNSLLTIGTIYLFINKLLPNLTGLKDIIWMIGITNYIPELLITVFIMVPVSRIITKIS